MGISDIDTSDNPISFPDVASTLGDNGYGDFVLTGGELAAMTMLDAISRFVPGVLGSSGSAETDSFGDGLLEYPQYTRPPVYDGKEVPDVLRSGDHKAIERWRRAQGLELTRQRRPDLLP